MLAYRLNLGDVAGKVGVGFEDALLGVEFARPFDATLVDGRRCKPDIELLGHEGSYGVLNAGASVCEKADRAIAAGAIEALLEERLRTALPPSTCTVHSCGIEIDGRAVALVGVSGSGKTTLGLAAAMLGMGYLGDEFGYLDLKSGEYWHAPYPIMTKSSTSDVLGLRELGEGLILRSEYGVEAHVYRRGDTLRMCGAYDLADKRLSLAAVVMPTYIPDADTSIEHVSVARWPNTLMKSLDWRGSRSELFSGLISLVSHWGIPAMSLRFGDPFDAVSALRTLWGFGERELGGARLFDA